MRPDPLTSSTTARACFSSRNMATRTLFRSTTQYIRPAAVQCSRLSRRQGSLKDRMFAIAACGFLDLIELTDHGGFFLAHVKLPTAVVQLGTDSVQCVFALVLVEVSAQRPLVGDISEEVFTERRNT